MDPRSEANLAHVHYDLARAIRAAAQAPYPFIVIQGLRTPAQEAALVAAGASKTLHSRHLPNAKGFACGVDVMPVIDGHDQFPPSDQTAHVYAQIYAQIINHGVPLLAPLQWGGAAVGAWTPGVPSTFHDWDHFQLPWEQYP